jgi:hypothetical protein
MQIVLPGAGCHSRNGALSLGNPTDIRFLMRSGPELAIRRTGTAFQPEIYPT